MSIKRWAKVYYNISPIYKDTLFNQPGNEELASINPRLLAAYCIKMNLQKHYSIDRIKGILNKYYEGKTNYWIEFTKKILIDNKSVDVVCFQEQMCQDESKIPLIKEQFQSLIKKIYNQDITKGQFSIFCNIFDFLTIKGEISQFDNYILDLSFRNIQQLVKISSINHEHVLDSIGTKSLQLLRQKLNKDIYPNTFDLIALINRIKDKENLPVQLCQLFYMFEGKFQGKFDLENQKYVGLHKQALGYMLWLLHLNQFGEFIFKFVKQDYLFSRYCHTSVVKTCQILQIMEIRKDYKPTQLILLNEIVCKLQNLQEQQLFFQHVKRDIQIQLKLKTLKQKIQQTIDQIIFDAIDRDSFIEEINHIVIDFKSSFSINVIKKVIKDLIQNPHFGIILREENYEKIINISEKLGDDQLYKKIRNKLKKKQIVRKQRAPSLLQYLCTIHNGEIDQRQYSLMINSIYELKRIKNLLSKLAKNPQFFKKYFKTQDQQTIKKLVTILNLGYKELSKHEIDCSLKKVFIDFKL